MSELDCVKCWAVRLCGLICFRHAFDEGGACPDKKRAACDSFREVVSERMAEMCSVLEANPSGLDFLNAYVGEDEPVDQRPGRQSGSPAAARSPQGG